MTNEKIERKYGKTKLDHCLSYFALAFEKILEFAAILFVPLTVVEQVVIYGEHHPDVVLPALIILMIVAIASGVLVIRHHRK
ncbi:hypothetical protein [uncultured Lactobacillus sp.]|uniref:hypothetical protein n=1 Tax=uncultured Lactobacillus sp. TaxID=153152 RepID=UPI0025839393|nr:hypothetical protein [uncultured Lactobacillus sp.]